MKLKLDFDVVVVGAGVAGMTAAIYLKRANMNVVMIENNAPGGQINRTSTIENYPGFEKIDGPTLAYNIFTQTQTFEIPYKYGDVIEVINKRGYKIIKTETEEIKCKAVIIATGRRPRELGLKNETNLTGKGISWCSICDGPLYKNLNVAVVGGGNGALEESIYLSEICKKVTIIHRRDYFTADKLLIEKALSKKNIEVKYSTVVTSLNESEKKLGSIDVKNTKTEKEENLEIDGLFIFIGNIPVSDMLEYTKVKRENGYINVDKKMKTNIKGIYACGDVIKKDVYQISTAVGEGATAALSLSKDYN